MSEPTSPRYGIDRLLMRGARIFGWGWIADRARAIDAIKLVVTGADGEHRLPVNYGLGRDDVKDAHPTLVNAGSSGFVVTGYVASRPVRKLILEVRFADDERDRIDITRCLEAHATGNRRLREIAWLANAVRRRLRHGDIAGILRRARAQNYGASSVDAATIVERVRPASIGGRAVSIVFDHNMGGGANLYRRTVIDERLASGQTVLLCTYNLPTLDYRLHIHQPGREETIHRMASFLILERVLDEARVDELFVNSPVSFDEPLVFAEWVAAMRARHPRLRLVVATHDYFSVCPSFVLLDADGRYCGIPEDVSECIACLARNRASYVMLSPPSEIGPWRALWERCLQAADEVRCFSESTRTLLLRAYPNLPRDRLRMIPHCVDFSPSRLPSIDHGAPLVIGIVGNISVQKGALVVGELVRLVDATRADVRVVVIGTLDAAPASRRLEVTGPYQRGDLGDLIERHGINLILVPSICPETFSYVTEEMMRLRMPIVAFDLGAPGERLRSYDRGRLCQDVNAEAAFATVREYHAELGARASAPCVG